MISHRDAGNVPFTSGSHLVQLGNIMSSLSFSLEIAQSLYNSTEQFSVSFDDAWQWLEYPRKDAAKRFFVGCEFESGIDYISESVKPSQDGVYHDCVENLGGRPTEKIRLTTDCFKMWGMMTGTHKGREIRLHFLECERKLKAILSEDSADINIEELNINADMVKSFIADMLNGENITFDQKLKLLREINKLIHSILQFCKLGMVDVARQISELLGIFKVRGENVRLAVQVQSEVRKTISDNVPLIPQMNVSIKLTMMVEFLQSGVFEFTGNTRDFVTDTQFEEALQTFGINKMSKEVTKKLVKKALILINEKRYNQLILQCCQSNFSFYGQLIRGIRTR